MFCKLNNGICLKIIIWYVVVKFRFFYLVKINVYVSWCFKNIYDMEVLLIWLISFCYFWWCCDDRLK